MQFVKTLFWVLVAVVAVLFASWNWHPVTVNLWANLQADIKLPVLLAIAFLLGWLPTWLIVRARLWSLQRRFEALERQHAPPIVASPTHSADDPAI
jgi:putative membrane protein